MSFTDEQKKFWRDWIDALRSSKFPQAKMTLKSLDGYCCLGVGCEIKGEGDWDRDFSYVIEVNGDDEYWGSEPNWSIYNKWLGLEDGLRLDHPLNTNDVDGGWQPDYFINICMTLNDDATWSFDEIADWVESVANEQGVFDD